MKRKLKIPSGLTIFFIIVFSCLFVANAQMKKVAQVKMQFLKLGIGARAAAMGDAFTALGGEPNSIFYNPAGCAAVQGFNFVVNQTNWIADINHKAGVLSYNTGRFGVFTVNYINVNYGTMERTVVDAHAWEGYISQGEFSVGEYAVGLGYATRITDRFFIGGQVKYAYQDLGTSHVWQYIGTQFETTRDIKNENEAVAYDFGTFYNFGFNNIRIGMSVQNFANRPLPLTFRFGAAVDLNEFLFPDAGSHVLTLAIDGLHPKDYSERVHFGLEYVFDQTVALRGGYKLNYDEESFSAGFGLKATLVGVGLQFDYAVTNFGALGVVNRFSLTFQP
ncbi:MAG: PorV/PorQ family protein [Ignavibacteriales bacterium]|nr:PorV/PorQ family protein [Ignavibacteriales bacterium]